MKKILTLLLIFISPIIAKCQRNNNCLDTLFVKGFILTEVSKSEIIRPNDKTYFPIDIQEFYLFVPFDENHKKSNFNICDSLKRRDKKRFFVFCPVQRPSILLSKTCIEKNSIKKNECSTPKMNSLNYYSIKGQKNKLYQIYYVEGNWLRIKYDPKENLLSSLFKIELIDTTRNSIDLYYLLRYSRFDISPNIDMKGVKKFKL